MSAVEVKPADSRKDRKAFLELPWSLYASDPNWIPPLRLHQKELVGYKRHPFYEQAEAQTFLARRDGQPCGRISAIINHAHNRLYKERRGFFGFFESVDDQEVATALLDAARQWLAERDLPIVRGPVNPSLNYECGLLVEGFDTPPFFMMTYNPPYYGRLLEQYGFQKAQDLYAFWGHVEMLQTLDQKLEFVTVTARERFEVKTRPMNRRRFRQELELFLQIFNRSMAGSWGFVPLSPSEIRHVGASLRYLIDPELTVVGEVDGKAIGSVVALLDYNPRIKEIDGRLLPFGFWKLIRNRRALKRVRLITANVLPEYQRWGIALVLTSGLIPPVLERGIQEAEFSWVAEGNKLSRGTLERGGAKQTKTYRIYDYESG